MVTGRVRKLVGTVAVSAAVAATAAGTAAMAGSDGPTWVQETVSGRLTGYQEDPLVISTRGRALFQAHIDEQQSEITYRLRYENLEGAVTQAHIHFGGKAQSGGIVAFLCSNLATAPAGTQRCPAAPATITGTIRPANVINVAGQGIAAGEFAEFVAAIRAGVTYANVHTTLHPGGEIRAQLEDHHHD
jgi:hypothetical protein